MSYWCFINYIIIINFFDNTFLKKYFLEIFEVELYKDKLLFLLAYSIN
jgi:hypothetical protein